MGFKEQLLEASARHPRPDSEFQYGTAGFRMKASLLDSVVFRVGLLAVLRSKKLNGQTVGVMITASHNPPADNGVKLVDPMGEMLESSWETHATALANAGSDGGLLQLYEKLTTELKIKSEAAARVVFARDTRASGPALVASLADALTAAGAAFSDYGLLTTPQLHYMVRCLNTAGSAYAYGAPTEQGYYAKLAGAFTSVIKHKKPSGRLTVDCANGVGGPKLRELARHLTGPAEGGLDVRVVNDDVLRPDSLNVQCGADFVKTNQRAPPSVAAGKMAALERCASLDGDADRIVYYFVDAAARFSLLDGDRIAALAASFLGDLGRQSGLASALKVGVVQTAYANGASTHYLTANLRLPVICKPTGVKHLHYAATRFDVGVYFEANGHGTVLFSPAALKAIATHEPQSPAQATALDTLRALSELINQTVGDALSDMLLVEAILAHKGWGPQEWMNTYVDLPNRLVRVEVANRLLFRAVDAERRLESPPGAQQQIDAVIGKYKQGRAFARASGTEDAVRVYAEAATRSEADDLAHAVSAIVKQYGTQI